MQLTRRLDENWDMMFGQGLGNYCTDAESVAQNVRSRLMLLQGEWFLDTDAGVPYLQNITRKPMDLAFAESVFKQTVLETDGVSSIDSFSMTFDSSARELVVSITVITIYGTTANIQVRT